MIALRYNTASQEIPLGPFLDSTDGDTAETGLTIANTDILLFKTGATGTVSKNSGGATHDTGGIYYCTLDATDTNTLGPLVIYCHVSGALAVRVECCVYPAVIYDSIIAGTDYLQTDLTQIAGSAVSATSAQLGVNVVQVSGDSTAADNLESDYDGTGYNKSNSTIGTCTTNTDMRGTDSAYTGTPPSSADIVNEWETQSQADPTGFHVNVMEVNGTAQTANDNGSDINSILEDTNEIQGKLPTNYIMGSSDFTDKDDEIDAIYNDTNTTLNGYLITVLDRLTAARAGYLDNLNIGENVAGVTDVSNAAANVSVDEIQASALADLFNTDSGTTYAAAVSGSPVKEIADNAGGSALTESGIADAVLDELLSGHTGAGSLGAAVSAILADTNELQTDWHDGGRLDLLLDGAASAGDPWTTSIPGAYGAGTAGYILGNYIDASISSRSDFDESSDQVTVATNNDKTGYSISGTKQTLDDMNDIDGTGLSVDLNDDAITASKFDETTAFPLASADSGDTAVARTGADSDTLETLSDQIDGVSTFDHTSNQVTVATNNDKTGYSISGTIQTLDALDTAQDSQHGTTQSAISALNNLSSSDVTTACTSAINTYNPPTYTEMTNALSSLATSAALATVDGNVDSIVSAIGALNDISVADILGTTLSEPTDLTDKSLEAMVYHIFARFFHKNEQTATQQITYKADGETALGTRTTSDDGTTQTLGEAS